MTPYRALFLLSLTAASVVLAAFTFLLCGFAPAH